MASRLLPRFRAAFLNRIAGLKSEIYSASIKFEAAMTYQTALAVAYVALCLVCAVVATRI